jgi:hypothetical protein
MDPPSWGSRFETALLRTDDPQRPRIVAALMVSMPETVRPVPARLAFDAREGEPAERSILLLLPEKAGILAVQSTCAFLDAGEVDTGGSGIFAHQIHVSLSPRAPAGTLTGEIVLSLRDAPVPQVAIPARVVVEPDVQAQPREVFVGTLQKGASGSETVRLESYQRRPFTIRSVASRDPRITALVDGGQSDYHHDLVVHVSAVGTPGSLIQGELEVTLSTGQVLHILATGMIASPEPGCRSSAGPAVKH